MSTLSLVESTPYLPPLPRSRREPDPSRFDDLAERLTDFTRDGNVEQAIELGRAVLETLYDGDLSAWRRRGSKAHSLRALARRSDLSVSSSALYRSVALYELDQRLGGLERWSSLGISHLRLVLGLTPEEQRRLLDKAQNNAWTVAELEREAVAVRKGNDEASRGGRPRLPRFVKSAKRLRKTVEEPGELFGDIEAAAQMAPEKLAEIRDWLSTVRTRCDELDRALEHHANEG